MWNLYADLVLRALMGAPGRCLEAWERIGGGRDTPTGWPSDDIVRRVQAATCTPEAWLALETGLEHAVSAHGVMAYRVRGKTGFAVGGLNVSPENRQALLQSYLQAARSRGCRRMLAFPLRPDDLEDAAGCGMDSIQVGMEAWLDIHDLTFEGPSYAHVRQMSSRARRGGVAVRFTDDPSSLRGELDRVHTKWLTTRRPSWRMALLIGTPCLDRPYGRRYAVATHGGRVCGFLTVVPAGPASAAVDVMCRTPDAPNGTMEHLMLETVAQLRSEGVTTLSLGPCPMAGLDAIARPNILHRIFQLLYRTSWGNRIFGFRGLVSFKNKFRPRWEPIFIAATPRVSVLTLYMGCRMWRLL